MDLNELLLGKGIDPHQVLVFRHRPTERELNKVFPLLAADKPDLFNAYQQTHGEKVEKAMTRAGYVTSFIDMNPAKHCSSACIKLENQNLLLTRNTGKFQPTSN